MFSRVLFFIVSGLINVLQISHDCCFKSIYPLQHNHPDPAAGTAQGKNMLTRVAVYGTLNRGADNHHLLADAQYLGNDSLHAITLYDLGPFPGAKEQTSEGIDIEVYAVTDVQLRLLDELEDYHREAPEQGMYSRVTLQTRFGSAWVYIYNGAVDGLPVLRCGSWRPVQSQTEVRQTSDNNNEGF